MIFFCDEGVDRHVVLRLRMDGFETHYVAELSPSISDDVVLECANTLGAVLVTMDKDFGELVYRLGKISSGVLLVRLSGYTPAERADAVSVPCANMGTNSPAPFPCSRPPS